jgi:hypothetical protein
MSGVKSVSSHELWRHVPGDRDEKEYDFSAAEQGKFYCKPEHMKILVRRSTVSEPKLRCAP